MIDVVKILVYLGGGFSVDIESLSQHACEAVCCIESWAHTDQLNSGLAAMVVITSAQN